MVHKTKGTCPITKIRTTSAGRIISTLIDRETIMSHTKSDPGRIPTNSRHSTRWKDTTTKGTEAKAIDIPVRAGRTIITAISKSLRGIVNMTIPETLISKTRKRRTSQDSTRTKYNKTTKLL